MIKFSYHRNPKNPKRVLTLARRLVKDENSTYVELGFALCSPKDIFSKERGRQIAIGRLEKNPFGSHRALKEKESPLKLAVETLVQLFEDCEGNGKLWMDTLAVPSDEEA